MLNWTRKYPEPVQDEKSQDARQAAAEKEAPTAGEDVLGAIVDEAEERIA